MGDLWRMTVADRRWWIGQTIDFIRQQNEANSGKGTQSSGRSPNQQQNPGQIQAAREMLKNYHNISSADS